jgi:hypothetical protein
VSEGEEGAGTELTQAQNLRIKKQAQNLDCRNNHFLFSE